MNKLPSGYKQTEVGVIPEDWEVKPLCNVTEIRSGIAKNSNISVSDPVIVHYLQLLVVLEAFHQTQATSNQLQELEKEHALVWHQW